MDHVNVQGTDEDIKAALLDINLPNLLLSMYCITGDQLGSQRSSASARFGEGSLFPDDTGGYSDAQAMRFEHQRQSVNRPSRRRTAPGRSQIEQFRELSSMWVKR